MRKVILILLLLTVNASAISLDSTRQVRVRVYSLLNLDTTGVAGLPTNIVDDYVYMGIREINAELGEYEKNELITATDGKRFTVLDSTVYLVSCDLVYNDSLIGIRIIRSGDIRDSVSDINLQTQETEYKYPTHVFRWGDSIGFVPPPIRTDTFRVCYIHVLPDGVAEIQKITAENRVGVVYYAAYLAAIDMDSPKAAILEQKYKDFIASRVNK